MKSTSATLCCVVATVVVIMLATQQPVLCQLVHTHAPSSSPLSSSGSASRSSSTSASSSASASASSSSASSASGSFSSSSSDSDSDDSGSDDDPTMPYNEGMPGMFGQIHNPLPCTRDVALFCETATQLIEVMSCLHTAQNSLSDTCKQAVMDEPMFHCAEDMKTQCPYSRGPQEILGCMKTKLNLISPACKSVWVISPSVAGPAGPAGGMGEDGPWRGPWGNENGGEGRHHGGRHRGHGHGWWRHGGEDGERRHGRGKSANGWMHKERVNPMGGKTNPPADGGKVNGPAMPAGGDALPPPPYPPHPTNGDGKPNPTGSPPAPGGDPRGAMHSACASFKLMSAFGISDQTLAMRPQPLLNGPPRHPPFRGGDDDEDDEDYEGMSEYSSGYGQDGHRDRHGAGGWVILFASLLAFCCVFSCLRRLRRKREEAAQLAATLVASAPNQRNNSAVPQPPPSSMAEWSQAVRQYEQQQQQHHEMRPYVGPAAHAVTHTAGERQTAQPTIAALPVNQGAAPSPQVARLYPQPDVELRTVQAQNDVMNGPMQRMSVAQSASNRGSSGPAGYAPVPSAPINFV